MCAAHVLTTGRRARLCALSDPLAPQPKPASVIVVSGGPEQAVQNGVESRGVEILARQARLRPRVGTVNGRAAQQVEKRRNCQGPVYAASMSAPAFVHDVLGWRGANRDLPNVADKDSVSSLSIAREMFSSMGITRHSDEAGQTLGDMIEVSVEAELQRELTERRPNVNWVIGRGMVVSHFQQYGHLARVQELVETDETLRAEIGADYLIRPDVTVGFVVPEWNEPVLHAAVSCKFTIRSDRVQNIRHEGIILVRHRRGRLPHVVSVTLEPMPTRLAAIARGTGEVDCVYHLAFDELVEAVDEVGNDEQSAVLDELVDQDRLASWDDLLVAIARV